MDGGTESEPDAALAGSWYRRGSVLAQLSKAKLRARLLLVQACGVVALCAVAEWSDKRNSGSDFMLKLSLTLSGTSKVGLINRTSPPAEQKQSK